MGDHATERDGKKNVGRKEFEAEDGGMRIHCSSLWNKWGSYRWGGMRAIQNIRKGMKTK